MTATTTIDAKGEPVKTVYSDGTPEVDYTFDKLGREAGSTGAASTATVFDSLGEPISVTRGGRTVAYHRSAPWKIDTITYPNGKSVTRGYDSYGRWDSVSDWNDKTTSFAYDHDGRVETVSDPNGVSIGRRFDADGNITKVTWVGTGQNGFDWPITFARGAGGEITSASTFFGTTGWGYDPASQVTSSSTATFGFDPAGNPTSLINGMDPTGLLCVGDLCAQDIGHAITHPKETINAGIDAVTGGSANCVRYVTCSGSTRNAYYSAGDVVHAAYEAQGWVGRNVVRPGLGFAAEGFGFTVGSNIGFYVGDAVCGVGPWAIPCAIAGTAIGGAAGMWLAYHAWDPVDDALGRIPGWC